MRINLKITASASIQAPNRCDNLDEKRIVPKMMLRRRLTRASKILLYLSDRCNYTSGKVIFGSAYGEAEATASIVSAIEQKSVLSPTAFQNSVYNTPISYFSLLHKNHNELLTLSNGNNTSKDVLEVAALESLYSDELLCAVVEAFDIDKIDTMNRCGAYHEAGVAFRVQRCDEEANLQLRDDPITHLAPSLWHMQNLYEDLMAQGGSGVVEITL